MSKHTESAAKPWPWMIQPGATSKSWHVARRPAVPKHVYDMEYFKSPGCKRARRFLKLADAQAFADKLNAALAKAQGGEA